MILVLENRITPLLKFWQPPGFLAGLFSGGGGAKSIVAQISFVMVIFLLFSDQIAGGGKVSEGWANCLSRAPPCGGKSDRYEHCIPLCSVVFLFLKIAVA